MLPDEHHQTIQGVFYHVVDAELYRVSFPDVLMLAGSLYMWEMPRGMPRGCHVAVWKLSSGGVDLSEIATWHVLPRQHRYSNGNGNVTCNGKCNGNGNGICNGICNGDGECNGECNGTGKCNDECNGNGNTSGKRNGNCNGNGKCNGEYPWR